MHFQEPLLAHQLSAAEVVVTRLQLRLPAAALALLGEGKELQADYRERHISVFLRTNYV